MREAFDIVVIGGGHNGLACAAYLAKAGKCVAVVESREILGGYTTTERPFSNHPNALSSMASMDFATANLPPSIIDDLKLADHGLELIDLDPFYSYLTPEGRSLIFWRDVEKTCAEIAAFSRADADAYRQLTQDMVAFWRSLAPYMQAHPTRPGWRALAAMARQALGSPKRLGRAARMMMMSPRALLDSLFENEDLKAALGNFAAASTAPLDQPGSGIILSMMAMQHEWGVRRPMGGMGSFADALTEIGASHGVRFFTGTRVAHVRIEGGRAVGVVLEDGRVLDATEVIGALDPKTLMLRLLPAEHLPAKVKAELAGMTVFANNIASARVDLLVQRKPDMAMAGERADQMLQTSMLIGPSTLDGTQAFIAACAQGRLEEEVPVWAASPSMVDRTLVGGEADQQTFYIYVPAVPMRLAGGQPWAERRDELGDKVVRMMARVMPGLESLILARATRTPEDFEGISGLDQGCMYHADMSLSQMGPWRPTPSLAGYATPVPGLWHTGAGAHPMGSVNGISGRLAAETVLKGRRSS